MGQHRESGLLVPVCYSLGLIFGLTASSCFVFMTTTPCWYVSYAEASISPYENCYGLWKFCSSTGLCGKWLSGSLLGAHGAQRIVCRSFMISACLLSGLALILNIFGMNCVLLFNISWKTKEKMIRGSSITWIVAGTFVLVSSTWYALNVMHLAWDDGKAIELSDGIFVGWGSTGFSYVAAAFLIVGATASRRHRKRAIKRRNSIIASVSSAAEKKRVRDDTINSFYQHFQDCEQETNDNSDNQTYGIQILEPMHDVVLYAGNSRMTISPPQLLPLFMQRARSRHRYMQKRNPVNPLDRTT